MSFRPHNETMAVTLRYLILPDPPEASRHDVYTSLRLLAAGLSSHFWRAWCQWCKGARDALVETVKLALVAENYTLS